MTQAAPSTRTSARVVLALGILVGLGLLVMTYLTDPTQFGISSSVYYHAAEAALAGEDFYAAPPPDTPGYSYIYPPIVLLAFLPHALLGGPTAALALQTVLNVAAGVATALVIVRALERRGTTLERVDYVLVIAFCVLSSYALPQIVQGQVTLWLAFAFAVSFDALDRRRERLAGAALALAAVVKLFPAFLGLWLLRRRAWRAVAVAVATGLGGLLAGLLVFGTDPTIQYLAEVLPNRFADQTFEGRPDPTRSHVTVRRQVAGLVTTDEALVTPLSALVLAPFVAACYRRVDADERRLAAILATILATIMFFPFQPLYFSLLTFPLLLLLYRLPRGRPRTLLVAGILWTYVMAGHEAVELLAPALPGGLESAAVSAADAVFSVILPPTVGMWLLLVACVLVVNGESVVATAEEGETVGGDHESAARAGSE